ncbi:hypothetical protein KVT40_001878 [Elsinoe batatas]|uniref:Uncharacterized protein n=1 Tax=Elsinoe batatas TaxID=2601811 RepID=A0A8K0L5U7_9PEZI|nr:hypothetical protein KVT40_001878 [Elsinoe batatas]
MSCHVLRPDDCSHHAGRFMKQNFVDMLERLVFIYHHDLSVCTHSTHRENADLIKVVRWWDDGRGTIAGKDHGNRIECKGRAGRSQQMVDKLISPLVIQGVPQPHHDEARGVREGAFKEVRRQAEARMEVYQSMSPWKEIRETV